MITHQPSFTAAGKGGVPTNPPLHRLGKLRRRWRRR